MDLKLFMTVFATIFVAEIGDKTQLATILYAANTQSDKITVFLGAASALILASAIGVVAGSLVSQHINGKYLSWLAGLGFIAVGFWTIAKA